MSADAATAASTFVAHTFFVSRSYNAGGHQTSADSPVRSRHCPKWRQLHSTPNSAKSRQLGSLRVGELRRGGKCGPLGSLQAGELWRGGECGSLYQRARQCVLVRASVEVKGETDATAQSANDRFRGAAKLGDLRLCKELLESGNIDVNQPSPDKGGWTALQLSVFYQHPEVAEFLLDNGADIDGRNASGNTALQFACIKSDVRLADLLIGRGADVFAQSNDKGTAIDYAEEWGGEDIVNFIHLKATQQSQMGAS